MCQSITSRQGRSLGLSRYMPEKVFFMMQKMKTERLTSGRMGLSWKGGSPPGKLRHLPHPRWRAGEALA